MGKLCHILDTARQPTKDQLADVQLEVPLELKDVKEGRDVRGGLWEEVDLQPDLEGFKKKEVISGEEMENTPDFEAQRKRWFPLPFLATSTDI